MQNQGSVKYIPLGGFVVNEDRQVRKSSDFDEMQQRIAESHMENSVLSSARDGVKTPSQMSISQLSG